MVTADDITRDAVLRAVSTAALVDVVVQLTHRIHVATLDRDKVEADALCEQRALVRAELIRRTEGTDR